ncbi:MAG: hypothetical protein AAFX81_14615 [Pseudomonadota bacterium]
MYALLLRLMPRWLATLVMGCWFYALILMVVYLASRYDLGDFAYWRI